LYARNRLKIKNSFFLNFDLAKGFSPLNLHLAAPLIVIMISQAFKRKIV